MPTGIEFFRNFVLPALIVAVGFAVGWWPLRRRNRDGRWIGALAVGAAFAVADCGIAGVPRWPPGTGDAASWLIWFAIGAALLGLIDALLRPPLWARAGMLFVLARIAGALLIGPLMAHADSAGVWANQIALDAIALVAVLWWLGWENLAERISGPFVPILLTLVLAGMAVVLGLSNNVKPSQAMVAMTGTSLVAIIAGWRQPALSLDRGAVLAWIVPPLGLLAFSDFYSYTQAPAGAVVLILIAPLLAFIGDLPRIRRLPPGWRGLVRIIPVVLAIAAAIGLSAFAFQSAALDSQS